MSLEVWKSIKLGTGLRTGRDFRRAFNAHHYTTSSAAELMLKTPAFAATIKQEETEVDLFNVSVAELGFSGACLGDVYKRGAQLGFELCSAEVGPQLILQVGPSGLPKGELFRIAMAPIIIANPYSSPWEPDDGSFMFCVVHGERWKCGFWKCGSWVDDCGLGDACGDSFWPRRSCDCFVFTRPRNLELGPLKSATMPKCLPDTHPTGALTEVC